MDKYKNNGIADCWFCMSHKTNLIHKTNRNPGRDGIMVQVRCHTCNARGPIVTKFYRDDVPIEEVEKLAIEKWNHPEGLITENLLISEGNL